MGSSEWADWKLAVMSIKCDVFHELPDRHAPAHYDSFDPCHPTDECPNSSDQPTTGPFRPHHSSRMPQHKKLWAELASTDQPATTTPTIEHLNVPHSNWLFPVPTSTNGKQLWAMNINPLRKIVPGLKFLPSWAISNRMLMDVQTETWCWWNHYKLQSEIWSKEIQSKAGLRFYRNLRFNNLTWFSPNHLSIAAHHYLDMIQIDVKTAFLYG
jgi:hypothetical protein